MSKDLKAVIGADISDFDKKMAEVSKSLQDVGKQMSDVGKTMSMTFTAGIVAAGVGAVALSTKVGNMADRLLDLEQITGFSTDALQEWEVVAIEAGVSTDVVQNSMKGLTSILKTVEEGSETAGQGFDKLGVSIRNSDGSLRDMGQIFEESVSKLADIEDTTKRNFLAQELFGRSWTDLAPILALGSDRIADVRAEAHELGLVLDRDSLDGANSFRIAWEKLTAQFDAAFNSLGAKLAPLMEEVFIPMIKDNILPLIQSFGDRIANLITWFKNLSPFMQKFITIAIGIVAAIGPVLFIVGKLITMLPMLGAAFTLLTGPIGLIVVAVGAAVGLIIAYWDEIVEYFTTGDGATFLQPFVVLFNGIWKQVAGIFRAFSALFRGDWAALWNELKGLFVGFIETVVDLYTSFNKLIIEGIKSLVGILNKDWANALDKSQKKTEAMGFVIKEMTKKFVGYEEQIEVTVEEVKDFVDTTQKATDSQKGLNNQLGTTVDRMEQIASLSGQMQFGGGGMERGGQLQVQKEAEDTIGNVMGSMSFIFGQEAMAVAEDMRGFMETAQEVEQESQSVMGGLLGSFMGGLGDAGGAISSFATGDLIGGFSAIFSILGENSEMFNRLLEIINETIGELITELMPILEVLFELLVLVVEALRPLIDIILAAVNAIARLVDFVRGLFGGKKSGDAAVDVPTASDFEAPTPRVSTQNMGRGDTEIIGELIGRGQDLVAVIKRVERNRLIFT